MIFNWYFHIEFFHTGIYYLGHHYGGNITYCQKSISNNKVYSEKVHFKMEKIQNGTYSASNTIKLNDKLIQVNAKIEVKINSEITENDYYKNKWRQIVKTKIIPNLIRQKNMEKLNSPYNIRRQSVVSYDSNISPALTPKLSPRRKSR